MNISDFIGKYHGKVGVIYGKGPSILRHDFARDAEFIKVAINDAGYTVPACDYLFLHDAIVESTEIMRLTKQISPQCQFVLPEILPFGFVSLLPKGTMPKEVCWYKKSWILCPDKKDVDTFGQLWHGHCTAHSALHFLHIAGVKIVRLIGFDGIGNNPHSLTYQATSEAHKKEMLLDENHERHATEHYSRYRRMLIGMALLLGIEVEIE